MISLRNVFHLKTEGVNVEAQISTETPKPRTISGWSTLPFILFPLHLSLPPSITHPLIEVPEVTIGANKELLVGGQILLTYKGKPSAYQQDIM